MSVRQMLALLTAACLLAAGALAVTFQDTIALFNLNPRTPYQTYTPPPPPAYGARGAWGVWPDHPDEDALADIFYVHSTTYASRRHWNAPLTAPAADELLRRAAAPNEAGPFMTVGPVYGPRYRQATLFASFTDKFDGLAAHELAYSDVEAAFEFFLGERQPDRPFILVGYGQGGVHVLGLLQRRVIADKDLKAHLAAAYVIGQPTPMSIFDNALAAVRPCTSSDAMRCVVAYIDLEARFDEEQKRHRSQSLIWDNRGRLVSQSAAPLLCVNPLTWTMTSRLVPSERHIGAASATGLRLSETPPAIAKATEAQCVDGILEVSSPRQHFLRRGRWFGAQWRPKDFNLFFHDLSADATRRAENLKVVLAEEARFLEPIDEAVDLEVSPVNKAPE